jgi:hypothetical protein
MITISTPSPCITPVLEVSARKKIKLPRLHHQHKNERLYLVAKLQLVERGFKKITV